MSALFVVVSGVDAESGRAALRRIQQIIRREGATVAMIRANFTGPRPTGIGESRPLVMLALSSLHDAHLPITAEALQARIGFSAHIAGRTIAWLIKQKVIEPTGVRTSPPAYKLSSSGISLVEQWFAYLIHGSRLRLDHPQATTRLELGRRLRAMAGLVVADTTAKPAPYEVKTLILILTWIKYGVKTSASAAFIAERLRCDAEIIKREIAGLHDAGLITPPRWFTSKTTLRSKNPYFRLTPEGMTRATNYLSRLMA